MVAVRRVREVSGRFDRRDGGGAERSRSFPYGASRSRCAALSRAAPSAGPNAARDRLILESKDFRRSIDYLVSRPDVDRDRLGVLGMSRCVVTPVLAVGEQRLKAAVLLGCGLSFDRRQLPEADPFNFLPRFQVPTLMVGGRSDFVFPLETSMRPMFRLLGAPEKRPSGCSSGMEATCHLTVRGRSRKRSIGSIDTSGRSSNGAALSPDYLYRTTQVIARSRLLGKEGWR